MVFSTFFGGNDEDVISDISYFKNGEFVVSGWTASTNFKTTPGAYDTVFKDINDAFVSKFYMAGSRNTLVFSTLIGTLTNDQGTSVSVDVDGDIYLTGTTNSPTFPLISAFGKLYAGGIDGFVTKLKKDGKSLLFSSYLGGNKDDYPTKLRVNKDKNAFITGYTNSTNFPVQTGAFQTTLKGMNDIFVAKISATGASLEYCTYIGGSSEDKANSLDVDKDGSVYVVGETSSGDYPMAPFRMIGSTPVDKPFSYRHNGNLDVFVTKVNLDGSKLDYSTFFGGSADDRGLAVAADNDGTLYFAGTTQKETSSKKTFPVAGNVYAKDPFGGWDCFLAKLDKIKIDGSGYKYQNLLFTTFFGGSGDEAVNSMVREEGTGILFMTGWTTSGSYPIVNDLDAKHHAKKEMFFTKFSNVGSDIPFSTIIGGDGDDIGYGIAIDARSDAYLAGQTSSSTLTTVNSLIQSAYGGGTNDGLIAKYPFGDIYLTDPTGNEHFCQGANLDVKWSSSVFQPTDSFMVEIYRAGGKDRQVIGQNLNGTSFTWKIPDNYPTGNDYFIRIAHLSGVSATNSIPVTIDIKPTITDISTNPQIMTLCEGDSITLKATVLGNNLQYQWYFNNQPITAAKDSILRTTATQSGQFHLNVTGSCPPAATSSKIDVTVKPATRLSITPKDTCIKKGKDLILKPSVKGVNLKYEWRKNGQPIMGATDSSYSIIVAQLNHEGLYHCIITGDCGIDTNYKVMVRVDTTMSVNEQALNSFIDFRISISNSDNEIYIVRTYTIRDFNSSINILDNVGRKLSVVQDGKLNAGENEFTVDMSKFATGVYWVLAQAGTKDYVCKFVIAR